MVSMHLLLASALLAASAPQDPVVPATPLECGADRELDLHAADPTGALALEVHAGCCGPLFVWTDPCAEDLVLSVQDADGKVVKEDDDSGGGKVPCLKIDAAAGQTCRVCVRSKAPAPGCTVRIHVRCASETDSSRAAARELDQQGATASRKRKGKDFDAARALIVPALEKALETQGGEDSMLLADALHRAGSEAYQLAQMPLAGRAWRRMLAVRERLLPPGHDDLISARVNVSTVLQLLGQLEDARALQAALLADLERLLGGDSPLTQAVRRNLALSLRGMNRLAEARAVFEAALASVLRTREPTHPDVINAREDLAALLHLAGDDKQARVLYDTLLDEAVKAFPDGDARLAYIRQNYAVTLKACGEPAAARPLEEQALEDLARLYPPEHQSVMTARANLSTTLFALGELKLARQMREELLATALASYPDSSREVQRARLDLAAMLKDSGELRKALELEEAAVSELSAALEPDDPTLLSAQQGLAGTRARLGDIRGARAIEELILAARLRAFPDEHPAVQTARTNLGISLLELGETAEAAALLRKVLEIQSRTLPEDNADLQGARLNLAAASMVLGDLLEARALAEKALEIVERKVPRVEQDVLRLRTNLGSTLVQLGDLDGAQALFESILKDRSRLLPDDDPELQGSRLNMANVLQIRGDLPGARALQEKVLAVRKAALHDDRGDVQEAQLLLAGTLGLQQEPGPALELVRAALEHDENLLAPDHPRLLAERAQLAALLEAGAEFDPAEEQARAVLQARRTALPEDHPDLQAARHALARLTARRGDLARPRELALETCGVLRSSLARCAATDAPRQAEARADAARAHLDWILSLALRGGADTDALRDAAFETSEIVRAAPLYAAWMQSRVGTDPELEKLAESSHEASAEVARLARSQSDRDAWLAARRRADAAAGELVRAVAARSGAESLSLDVSLAQLAARLDAQTALVAYRSCTPEDLGPPAAVPRERGERLVAFVLRRDGALSLVDLGSLARVSSAVERWRAAVGATLERGRPVETGESASAKVRAAGVALRELAFDPLRRAIGDARRLVVALDGDLHAFPLDALPDGEAFLGDRCTIEVRPTLVELCWPARALPSGGGLIALGGADFNHAPEDPAAAAAAGAEDEDGPLLASRSGNAPFALRGGPWERAFDPLTYTAAEARGIAALHEDCFSEKGEPAIVLVKRQASSRELLRLAPGARWLHIATHGWFAPESVRSTRDPAPLDALSGLGSRRSAEAEVRGLSPLVLCGLALAGANLPADPFDRVEGIVTAEEMATWNLGRCELAVLSACDTNVGVRRAGLGVASLQRALHMAGARSVVASLWQVPDQATKKLFLDFYRRLWVLKEPKHQALWEAKALLRNARDDRGNPLYSTHDWAAWVLTGE